MAYTYLEFEKPISDLENKIESLRDNKDNDESVHQEISSLSDRIENLTKEIYAVSYTHLTLPTTTPV